MKDIRVAVAIFNSPVNKTEHNIDRMARWIKEAKRKDAEIICFPEMNVTGYGITGCIFSFQTEGPVCITAFNYSHFLLRI